MVLDWSRSPGPSAAAVMENPPERGFPEKPSAGLEPATPSGERAAFTTVRWRALDIDGNVARDR